jgi:hypothetical protein
MVTCRLSSLTRQRRWWTARKVCNILISPSAGNTKSSLWQQNNGKLAPAMGYVKHCYSLI